MVSWLALALIGLGTWIGKRMYDDLEAVKITAAKVDQMNEVIKALDVDVRKQLSEERNRGDASSADHRVMIREVHNKIELTTQSTNGRIDKLAENMSNQHAKILEMLVAMKTGAA